MTAVALHASQVSLVQLSWPRISAWSGSFSLHLLIVVLLLTPPVVLQLTRSIPAPEPVHIIHVIPPTVIPDLPQPVRHQQAVPVKRVIAPVPPQVQPERPDVSRDSPV